MKSIPVKMSIIIILLLLFFIIIIIIIYVACLYQQRRMIGNICVKLNLLTAIYASSRVDILYIFNKKNRMITMLDALFFLISPILDTGTSIHCALKYVKIPVLTLLFIFLFIVLFLFYVFFFVLLLFYTPSRQLWSWRDGQFT